MNDKRNFPIGPIVRVRALPIITDDPDPDERLMEFPLTQIGTSTTQYFTLQNDGFSDLIITGIAKTGIDADTGENFTLHYDGAFACPDPAYGDFTLAPWANCSVAVDFTPTCHRPIPTAMEYAET